MARVRSAAFGLALAMAGCFVQFPGFDPDADGEDDAGPDAARPLAPDARRDASRPPPLDAAPPADAAGDRDPGRDAGRDGSTGPDAGRDLGPDATSDDGVEAGAGGAGGAPDAGDAGAGLDAGGDGGPDANTDADRDSTTDATSDVGLDAAVDATPDAELDAAPDAAPPPPRHPGWCVERVDVGIDGRIDAIYTRTYDADGRTTLITYDDDANGVGDRRATYFYVGGRLVTVVYERIGIVGAVDVRVDYGYDVDSRLVRVAWDYTAPATPDMVWTWVYHAPDRYDRLVDHPAGGITEQRWRARQVPGNPVVWEQVLDRFDDVVTERRLEYYGPWGVTAVETYRPPAVLVARSAYQYDVSGNLLVARIDDPFGDLVERQHTYEYGCFP